jgi:hypothetical protein
MLRAPSLSMTVNMIVNMTVNTTVTGEDAAGPLINVEDICMFVFIPCPYRPALYAELRVSSIVC